MNRLFVKADERRKGFDPPAGSLQMSYPKKDYKAPFASEIKCLKIIWKYFISFIRKGEKLGITTACRINEENKI